MINKIYNFFDKNYIFFVYFSIFSIFINPVKIYIPNFCQMLILISLLIFWREKDKKVEKWQKSLFIFMVWAVISFLISFAINDFKPNLELLIKLLINFSFLLSTSLIIKKKFTKKESKSFIFFIEFIVLINFIQIILIYITGDLFVPFLHGELTSSSDSAYAIGEFYNIIGLGSKNIWSTKVVFINLIYLYMIAKNEVSLFKLRTVLVLICGGISILLLLSRTGQIAILIAYIVFIYLFISKMEKKYKYSLYILSVIAGGGVLSVFFKKYFHLSFNMTDGGFVRLLMWEEGLKNLGNKNLLIGNGFGSAQRFIFDVFNRGESNFHNVILNITFELGLIGLIIYLVFIFTYFKKLITKTDLLITLGIIILPI